MDAIENVALAVVFAGSGGLLYVAALVAADVRELRRRLRRAAEVAEDLR